MLHQIGIGTLGPVFRTYEPTRDRLVAVKVFRLDIVPETAYALAGGLGQAATASLVHPSIVEPIEAGVEGTLAYRAEEYVAAESLDVAMRHYAPAPIEKVLPFITQLAGAIDFARAAGIGHGGLHPRDIFVTPDEARATGFGVVQALEQVGIRAPIRRPYSAPERIAGSAWSTPADVFSLAAITFELLTGRRPSGTGKEIGALPEGPHTKGLLTVLARAMDDDPAKRHTSALAFASALEAASQGRPVTDVVVVPVVPAPAPPAPEPPVSAPPAPPLVVPHAASPVAAEPLTAAPPAIVPALAMTDEFAVESELEADDDMPDEIVAARDVRPVRPAEPSLFDDEEDVAGQASASRAPERFAFLDQDVKTGRLDDTKDRFATADDSAAEAAMFQAGEPEVELPDDGDRGRPALLPYAVFGVLMLLIGFGAGYFVKRDRGATAQQPEQSASAPSGKDFSDEKVTPPPAKSPPAAAHVTTPPSAPAPVAKKAPPAPAAVKGQIVVHSQPSHAGVTVNGTWRGRTPLTIENVEFGAYTVRVVEPGYRVAHDEFTLSAHEPSRTVTARLERAGPAPAAPGAAKPATPAPTTGSLYVDSRPRGATVTVDGRSAGQTPIALDVSPGTHQVRIEMEGKRPVTANPKIVAGQTERVTVSLEDKQE